MEVDHSVDLTQVVFLFSVLNILGSYKKRRIGMIGRKFHFTEFIIFSAIFLKFSKHYCNLYFDKLFHMH